MPGGDGTGPVGQGPGVGRGRGQCQGRRRGPYVAGPGGNCTCSGCGTKIAHTPGQPCNQQICPKCGAKMTRE